MHEDSPIAKIYNYIKEQDREDVYIVNDFLHLGSYHAVRKALLRLADSGKIKKIINGVYYNPQYCSLIGEYASPNPYKVASALSRKYHWTIAPSGDTALNLLGLSTQVVVKWSFISDGPYRVFDIGNVKIEFKHRANREISNLSYMTALTIQALKALGRENISQTQLSIIQRNLSKQDKDIMLQEARYAPTWIYNNIKKICE